MPLCGTSRAVLSQALVHQGDDLVQRVGLQSLLTGDPTDQAINPHHVLDAPEKRPRRGRGFGQASGRKRVRGRTAAFFH